MIKLYKEIGNKCQDIECKENFINSIEENMWIHMVNPTQEEVRAVCEKTGLNSDMLLGALDVEEQPI